MKITGTISNSTTASPISDVRVRLVIAQIELAVLYSDEAGTFEYSDSTSRIGETLVIRLKMIYPAPRR